MVIHQGEMHVDLHSVHKGINFWDHYKNINALKGLDDIMNRVKKRFKNNDLDGFLIRNGDHGYKLNL